MSTSTKLQTIYLSQQLDPEYWVWGGDPKLAPLLDFQMGNDEVYAREFASRLLGFLVERLEAESHGADARPVKVIEAYGIVHDKDMRNLALPGQPALLEPKPVHLHAYVKFEERSLKLERISQVLGVEPQYLEKPKRGGCAVDGHSQSEDNHLAYLTHVKYIEKYQYSPEQVATVRGTPYGEIYDRRFNDWFRGRATVTRKRAKVALDVVLAAVREGRVTREELLETPELYEVYSEFSVQIDRMLDVAAARRALMAAKQLRRGEFHTSIFFVHGVPGSGKTLIAEDIAEELQKWTGWRLFRAAQSNALDDWLGEEILLLDEVRADSMRASEWLTLLDPYHASPASARYRNKIAVAPRVIILTAFVNPVEFFCFARKKGNLEEALDQFVRRLMATVQVIDTQSYWFHRIGVLADMRRGVAHAFKTPVDAWGNRPHLTRGIVDSIACAKDGVTALVLADVAAASPDTSFADNEGWSEISDRILAIESAHEARAAELEADYETAVTNYCTPRPREC